MIFIEEKKVLRMGSLFDGIGGFMVAAEKAQIIPKWASEIEPNCITITKHHFPRVPHLGDITAINGAKIEPVSIITFGSPCQDLSISGKRQGLSGERSGLFMEAIRIIREMRKSTKGNFPRYAIWENVPGALSSNNCDDFRIVLEEFVNTAEIDNTANTEIGGDENSEAKRITKIRNTELPKPKQWGNAGSIMGNNGQNPFSIAWRVLDSQYFGVPQRRKRVFLMSDFGGECAEEILFERKILPRDFEQSKDERKNNTTNTERSIKTTINNNDISELVYNKTFSIIENIINRSEKSGGNGIGIAEDICYTLTTSVPHAVVNCSLYNQATFSGYKENSVTGTLTAHLAQEAADLVVDLGSQGNRVHYDTKSSCTLTRGAGGFGGKSGIYFFEDDYKKSIADLSNQLSIDTENLLETIENIIDKEGIESLLKQGYKLHINGVRRLTPLECERLQGYEDYWTEVQIADKKGSKKTISDNARYKALGNSVCVDVVVFLLKRLKNSHFAELETR